MPIILWDHFLCLRLLQLRKFWLQWVASLECERPYGYYWNKKWRLRSLWVYRIFRTALKWFPPRYNFYTFNFNTSKSIEKSTSSINCPNICSKNKFFILFIFIIYIFVKKKHLLFHEKKPKKVYVNSVISVKCMQCLTNMIHWLYFQNDCLKCPCWFLGQLNYWFTVLNMCSCML